MLARRISFFLMVFLVSVTVSAQKDVLEFSHLTTADGLTHSNVPVCSRTVMVSCGSAPKTASTDTMATT